jgi:hypothetical protein
MSVRHRATERGHDVGVADGAEGSALRGHDGVLSIQPLTSGVGLSPMLAAWASYQGRNEIVTGGVAAGRFTRGYGLDARGVEVSEGRDHVSLGYADR